MCAQLLFNRGNAPGAGGQGSATQNRWDSSSGAQGLTASQTKTKDDVSHCNRNIKLKNQPAGRFWASYLATGKCSFKEPNKPFGACLSSLQGPAPPPSPSQGLADPSSALGQTCEVCLVHRPGLGSDRPSASFPSHRPATHDGAPLGTTLRTLSLGRVMAPDSSRTPVPTFAKG